MVFIFMDDVKMYSQVSSQKKKNILQVYSSVQYYNRWHANYIKTTDTIILIIIIN